MTITEQQGTEQWMVTVPVIAPHCYQQLRQRVDQVVCLLQPDPLQCIGLWYEDFSQVPDEVVCRYLEQGLCPPDYPA